jgi:biopolymer transport protein ExbD
MNLAPLLDVIFCLLFFFVLATSLRRDRQVMEVTLPESGQGARMEKEVETLEILISKENLVFFKDRETPLEELPDTLRSARDAILRGGGAIETVLIRTDGQANVQTFVKVSDACAKAGLESALMETLPARPE